MEVLNTPSAGAGKGINPQAGPDSGRGTVCSVMSPCFCCAVLRTAVCRGEALGLKSQCNDGWSP